MARIRLSKLTHRDLSEIADYTIGIFGKMQARNYRDGMKLVFGRLLRMPNIGRRADEFGDGIRAINYASHIIYYRHQDGDILIVRILHQSMDAQRQFD